MAKDKTALTKGIDSLFAKIKGKKHSGESGAVEDILDRDVSSFVWVDKEAKLIDWEEFTDGENLCSFQLKGAVIKDGKDALKKGISLVGSLRVVLGIPRTISLNITENRSFTDGNVIALGAGFFADPELSSLTKIDLLLGEYIHEGYHILYTDMKERERRIKAFEGLQKLYAMIHNVIEDERIEIKGGSEFPGFVGYIAKIKKYLLRELFLKELKEHLHKHAEEDKKEHVDKEREVVSKLFSIFHAIVRFPANLLEEDLLKYSLFIKDVQNVFSEGYPTSNKEALEKSVEVYELMRKHAYKEFEKLEKEKREDDGSDELSAEAKKGLGDLLDRMLKEFSAEMDKVFKDGADKAAALKDTFTIISGSSDKGDEDGKKSKPTKEFLKGIELDKIVDEEYRELEEVYVYGTTVKTKFFKAEENRIAYQNARASIGNSYKTFSTLLEREHRDLKLVLKGTKTGYLDQNKLVEAMLGSQHIYENYAYVRSKRVDVVVLADESGSMGNTYGKTGKRRSIAAMESCIMLKEALKTVKDSDLYIYGFTSDEEGPYTNQIRIYKEPGYDKKYALGSLQARDQNRDGDCIYETAVRVRKFSKNPCLFFVISDGEPFAANYSGYNHTKQMVEKVEKMGFVVVQIAITGSVQSHKMFKHWVTFTDSDSLPRAIGGVVKKLLRKLIKADISY